MSHLSQIKLPANLENLQQLIESVSTCAKKQEFNPGKVTEIEIALEEALVNIINYAYQNSIGDIKVTSYLDDDNRFTIAIEDTGAHFDVLSMDQPNLTSKISERKIGGLGIFFIRKLMNEVLYQRKDNKNILTLIP
ncbi:MAG: ATP-binding protein [Desulfobacterales bacterium]|jgi:serine/threonine-protein kinase RsbW|nr:ATP-binding protein [Desulfobacterales bacterium]